MLKHNDPEQNHNPRVGGSSPSSATNNFNEFGRNQPESAVATAFDTSQTAASFSSSPRRIGNLPAMNAHDPSM
jgi:hypothetical protein